MIWHEVKIVGITMISTMWMVLGIAEDWLSNIPITALGGLGFVVLVWRLAKDNEADKYVREGFQRIIEEERVRAEAERLRADAATQRAIEAEAENRILRRELENE